MKLILVPVIALFIFVTPVQAQQNQGGFAAFLKSFLISARKPVTKPVVIIAQPVMCDSENSCPASMLCINNICMYNSTAPTTSRPSPIGNANKPIMPCNIDSSEKPQSNNSNQVIRCLNADCSIHSTPPPNTF